MKKNVLIGIHDKANAEVFKLHIERFLKAEVVIVDNIKDMKKKAGKPYFFYLMDINLGKPGSDDISPVLDVWEIVKDRVGKKEAYFLAISGLGGIVEKLESANSDIPVETKPIRILKWLKDNGL